VQIDVGIDVGTQQRWRVVEDAMLVDGLANQGGEAVGEVDRAECP